MKLKPGSRKRSIKLANLKQDLQRIKRSHKLSIPEIKQEYHDRSWIIQEYCE